MGQKLHAQRAQPRTGSVTQYDHEAALAKGIRVALDDYLQGRRLVMVKIRMAEGRSVEGFLKIEGKKGERLLVDFKASATPQGELSSLEVGGRKISLLPGSSAKRTR